MPEEERPQQSSQPQNPPAPQPPLSQRFNQQQSPEPVPPAPVQPPQARPSQPPVPAAPKPPQPQQAPKAVEEPLAPRPATTPPVPPASKQTVPREEHYLNRADVRTMEKDIASLRHQETKKEREHITEIQRSAAKQPLDEQAAIERIRREAEAAKAPQEAVATMNSALPTPTVELSRELPRTPSHFQKVFVRVVIGIFVIGILINAGLVGYWYFFKKEGRAGITVSPTPAPSPITSTTPIATATPPVASTAPIPTPQQSPSVLPLAKTATIIISQGESFTQPLQRVFEQNNPEGFTKIEFKKEGQSQAVQFTEFFSGLNMTVPQDVQSQLQNTPLFFLFNGDRERIGFVASVRDETAAKTAMANWESALEQNAAAFTGLMGNKDSGYSPRFRTYAYSQVPVRFKTLSRNDIGICYAVYKNRLIFTTSLEAMEKVIDTLK
ncbi:MAG: hypothetical protein HYV77_02140 [Candidatus Wildermuthbacteria bacterium]|nr:hypothetical protein [Candidatus Wildermuthbacteria bacterium]